MGLIPSSSKSGPNDAHVAKIVTIDEARAKGAVRALSKQKNEGKGKGSQKGAKGRGRLSSRKEITIARGAYREGALYSPSQAILEDEPKAKRRSLKNRDKRKVQSKADTSLKKPQNVEAKASSVKTRALNGTAAAASQKGIPSAEGIRSTELRALKTVSFAKANQSVSLARPSLSISPSRALAGLPVSEVPSAQSTPGRQKAEPVSGGRPAPDAQRGQAVTGLATDIQAVLDKQAPSGDALKEGLKGSSEEVGKKKRPTVKNARKAARAEEKAAKKKARVKAKANKLFNASYDDSKSSGASAGSSSDKEAAPRAALYKGEMGSSQKKSTKLQVKSSPALNGIKRRFSDRKIRPSMVKVVASVAVAAICVVSLYGPAQQYYQQMRETDRLQAELEAVAARTNDLQDQIDVLATDAGVEDKAHKDMGYVKSGEQTAKVRGITFEEDLDFTSNVIPNSVPAPETWYSPVLDVVFGYSNLPSSS